MCKGKAIPLQSLDRPWRVPAGWGSQISRNSAHEGGKVVSPTHRPPLPPQEVFLLPISVRGWVDPRGHSAARRIISMKNSNDTIGNRTRDHPACSAVPQPTAPPRTTDSTSYNKWLICIFSKFVTKIKSITYNKNENKNRSYVSYCPNKDDEMTGTHTAHGIFEFHRGFWSEESTWKTSA
jgi:hypothetical protein